MMPEYQDPEEKKKENYNDHPDTLLREKRLLGLLTEYSAGHVTVRDRKTVCIDGTPLLTEAVAREGLTEKLRTLVHDAYAGEAASGAREKLVQREQQQALASYRRLHEVAPELRRIPDEYLKDIDPAALEKIETERAEAKKAAAEKKQQE